MRRLLTALLSISTLILVVACESDSSRSDAGLDGAADGSFDAGAPPCPVEPVSNGDPCPGFPMLVLCSGEVQCMDGCTDSASCYCNRGAWYCGNDCLYPCP